MKPTDLPLFRAYGRPALTTDGQVIAALTTPNIDDDRYDGLLHRLDPGSGPGSPTVLTRGPRDSAPVISPDGSLIVFRRAGESGPGQLYAMPARGGEPYPLVTHPLGAADVVFSPDGRSIAYRAAVPEPGRYGTEDGDESAAPTAGRKGSAAGESKAGPSPDAEAPRHITTMTYRMDGKGFLRDKLDQIFVLDLDAVAAGEAAVLPRQVTAEPVQIGRPAFSPDGTEIVYERQVSPDSLYAEIAAISAAVDKPGHGRTVTAPRGDASKPVVVGDTVYYVGAVFEGNDFAGRNPGLWAVPLEGGESRRLTDPATVAVESDAGEVAEVDGSLLIGVQDRGAVHVRAVPADAAGAGLDTLGTVIGGQRVVKSFTVSGDRIAAVVSDPGRSGDVVTGRVAALLAAGGLGETVLTDVSASLRTAGVADMVELNGTGADGYPVHGWLLLPPVDRFAGPHPVLLNVHGGPHAAYGWGVFDEAQMYATHGWAVVMGNPRGSSSYGEAHGRAIVGALGTVDAADVLALLDTALERDDLDGARVGLMGGSYGGFMTSWLASQAPGRFVAGISERAVNAWDSFAGSSDIGYFFADAYVGSDLAVQRDRSPLYHADGIEMPLLIIHSEEDWRCPIEQGQRLYVALKMRGHETEMLLFPGEGHELSRSGRPKHRVARFEAIMDWWSRYLPVR